MEDIFYIPRMSLTYEGVRGIVQQIYTGAGVAAHAERGLYIVLEKEPVYMYMEIHEVVGDELNNIKCREPEFWSSESPSQIFCITHKRAVFHWLKPLLLALIHAGGGSFCTHFDELYTEQTIDIFNY